MDGRLGLVGAASVLVNGGRRLRGHDGLAGLLDDESWGRMAMALGALGELLRAIGGRLGRALDSLLLMLVLV